MKFSEKLDQLLIHESDKLNLRLAFGSSIIGALTYCYLYFNHYEISMPLKLNLSVVIHIFVVATLYNIQIVLAQIFSRLIKISQSKVNTLFLMVVWLNTFYGASLFQYRFIYGPILGYLPPSDIEVIAVSIVLYSFAATMLFEYFRRDLEKQTK